MADTPTEPILAAAKYLREVRPLDPAELIQYVSEPVDPSTVRAELRRHAIELDILERPDGTFVPVPAAPPEPSFSGPTGLPDTITRRITDLLEESYGPEWYQGTSGDRLRSAIRSFKADYLAGTSVEYDTLTAHGYAIYHLPGGFAKAQYALDVLGRTRALPTKIRVLEIGTGVGATALGLAAYFDNNWLIEYHGIEPSQAAIDVCERLLPEQRLNIRWHLECDPIESAALDPPYDLVILANVLNELADPIGTIDRVRQSLTAEGTIVAIAPADEDTSRGLRRIERSVVSDDTEFDVFSPTLRLWPNAQPTDDCWSFAVEDPLEIPPFQRKLDEGRRAKPDERDPATGEFINVELRFSYAVLRADGARWTDVRPNRAQFAPLSDVEHDVGSRVNVAIVKLSHSLAESGENPLFVVGDGSQQSEHFAVIANQTTFNRTLARAPYGAILELDGTLVLWNADESAYNLIVDEQTIVDAICIP